MSGTFLFLSHDHTLQMQGTRKRNALRRVLSKGMSVLSGSEPGGGFTAYTSGTDPAYACTALISASGAGTVGISISGVALTAAFTTSDTVSMGLVAAVINASTDAKIQYLYGATNLKASVTLATVLAGTTLTFAGFIFTAIAGTAGAIPTKDGDFIISGTDTQDGTSLAGAINRHPYANKYLFAIAISGGGVVHVYPKSAAWFTGPNAPENAVRASAATVTVTNATFVASTHCGVYCKFPGKVGNGIVVAASGTGQTIENTNTYMGRGAGMDAAPITDVI